MRTLDYESPERKRKRKRFLKRPVWREWVLGGCLVAIGFIIAPSNPKDSRLAPLILLVLGAGILFCAAVHGIGVLFRWWDSDDP